MLTYFSLLIIIFLGLFLIYFIVENKLKKALEQKQNKELENFLELNQKITEFFQNLEKNLLEKFKILSQDLFLRYEETLKRQEKFIETSSKLEELARNLELSLLETKEIKTALLGPKTRGYFGEVMLEEILKTLPPGLYEKQFKLGFDYVDYVIRFNNSFIPIDAKFPYEKFKEDSLDEERALERKRNLKNNLKEKIVSISKKYIQPYKNTVEFAIMYLANEGIFYEILSDDYYDEIWNLARESNVYITSPRSFEILVSSLLLVLKKQEIAKSLNYIIQNLNQLEKDIKILEDSFEKAFVQLQNSYKNFTETSKILLKLSYNLRNLYQLKENELKNEKRSLI